MRGRIGIAGLVLLLGTGSLSCDGHHRHQDAGPPVHVANSTTKTPPPPLADAGPVPGTLTKAWSLASPLTTQPLPLTERIDGSHQIIGGQLIEESLQGLDVYDAQSGARRWFYHEPERHLLGYAATAGVIVVLTTSDDTIHTEHWTGIEAPTGRVLWSRAGTERAFIPIERASLYGGGHITAGGGVVPVSDNVSPEIHGIDVRTGRYRWNEKVPAGAGCKAQFVVDGFDARGDGSVVPLSVDCGNTDRIVAIDPATGHREWLWNIQPSDVLTSNGFTLVSSGDQGFSIIGPDGHELTRTGSGIVCSTLACDFVVTGGHAVVPYEDDRTRKSGVFLADVRTGRTATASSPDGDYESVAAAGGRVYAVTRQVSRDVSPGGYTTLLPGGLDVIDPATATIQRRPLPFSVETYKSAIGVDFVAWLGAAGGRLYVGGVRDQKETVTAYATTGPGTPAELGGVPASDWPDACEVAPGQAPDRGSNDPRKMDVFVGSIRLRHLYCTYGNDERLGVEIDWVAGTPAEAQSFLGVTPSSPNSDTHVRVLRLPGVDAAFTFDDELWIRTGRYIVRIYGNDPGRRELAQAVAKTLRSR